MNPIDNDAVVADYVALRMGVGSVELLDDDENVLAVLEHNGKHEARFANKEPLRSDSFFFTGICTCDGVGTAMRTDSGLVLPIQPVGCTIGCDVKLVYTINVEEKKNS